jgi:predicted nucleotidyltransferase
MAAVRDLAARIRAKLGARVRDVRLYGSFARDEAHAESDVDVFVLVADLSEAERRWLFETAGEVSIQHLLSIQVFAPRPEEHLWLLTNECRIVRDLEVEGVPA